MRLQRKWLFPWNKILRPYRHKRKAKLWKGAKEYGANHVTTGDQHRKYVKLKRGVPPELKMKNWRENINLDFFSDLQKLMKVCYII